MKFIFCVLFFGLISLKSTSQDSIRIIASGTAFTKEKAIFNALRNALEKGAGVYISSETVIQNEKLVFDEVASLSNGTIANYDIIESDFSEKMKEFSVTISANIVAGKFVNLIKSKGVNVSFNGSSFVQNVKLNNYYKEEEPKILEQFEAKLDLETIFKFFDKKILADEPKIYTFKNIDYQLELDKDWHKHANNDLIFNQRNLKQVVVDISGKEYIDPFYLQFRNKSYSFNRLFGFKDQLDNFDDTINLWKQIFDNKPNWSAEEKKIYSNTTLDKSLDWLDFNEFRIFDSMNHCFSTLNTQLKANSGGYVVNLTPVITINQNYLSFVESLKKLLETICINKTDDFSKINYEEKFGKTYSVFIYDYKDGELIRKEYVLRNYNSTIVYSRMISAIGFVTSGIGIVHYNVIRSNLGNLDNYIVGLELQNNLNKKSEPNIAGFILRPNDPSNPIATNYLGKNEFELYYVPKLSISHFVDLKTIEKINEYTIDNPPYLNILPNRPNNFIVDFAKKTSNNIVNEINNKLKQFNTKHGIEFFIVINNDSYGIDDMESLAKIYGYEWKIGGKEIYNGSLININPTNRKINVHYFRGLENKITTQDCDEAILIMRKDLKTGNYQAALNKVIDFFDNKLSTKK